MDTLLDLSAVIAPVVAGAGLGFLWARLGQPFPHDFVTRLVTMVGSPCLIGLSFTRLSVDLASFGRMAGAALLAMACFAVLGVVALRFMGLPRHSFLPALMFPNAGNMGLPLCLYAFGQEGLTLAIVYFAVFSVAQFTLGASIAAGSASARQILRLPLPYAVLASMPFLATRTPLPAVVANVLELFAGVTIPLMLLALGVSLARLRVASLGRALALASVRLGGGVVVGVALSWALGLH
ncbi:MAG: AEC family transporter, partial [Rhodospirillaceae bacterium]|nr:AEC family transporter [Rhodospirillaceae bacterium]